VAHDPQRTLDAAWRIEAASIIGALVRIVRDVGLAEELRQNARERGLLLERAQALPR
jgi:predicted RNA polymerase sigma factor